VGKLPKGTQWLAMRGTAGVPGVCANWPTLRHTPRHPPSSAFQGAPLMRRILLALLFGTALHTLPAHAQPAPEVTLARLDCGTGVNDMRRFSDTFAYSEPRMPFTFSCYVIKHGDDYMVWDTGFLPGSNPNAP